MLRNPQSCFQALTIVVVMEWAGALPLSMGAETDRKTAAARVAVSALAAAEEQGPAAVPEGASAAAGEPVRLARAARAEDVRSTRYDVIVVGGTAGGVACAVRAAREGCKVLLTQHNGHIGGMLANGLMQWDALYGGPRAPLIYELLGRIERHYIARFGRNSREHQIMRYTHEHYPVGWVEPHVMERECNRLVADEANITLLLNHHPVAVERAGDRLTQMTLTRYGGGGAGGFEVLGDTFVDATYEGDLMALAGVKYRVGREARSEYGEPHAGKVFVNIDHGPPQSVVEQGLNLRVYDSRQGSVDSSSTFAADRAIQAYNFRPCVTRDPENRVVLTAPPPGYNRDEYVNYGRKAIGGPLGPNQKSHMNSPILPGENHDYPEADWPRRKEIFERHKNFALGLIWFLQTDPSVPEAKRREFLRWGLPKDEFPDNGHMPYEMYVREARRLVGQHVLTEQDNVLAQGYFRTPIQPDSIATTDWYMDSHACTTESRAAFKYDGKLILTEESRPAQIPYRCLLPLDVKNLLVPVCLSATHVAWGAIRLEPVWMQTGEAAGYAAALARRAGVTPADLDPELLVRTLVDERHLVSFFNDVKVTDADPAIPAAEYFACKGFFHDYHARLHEPLKASTAKIWSRAAKDMRAVRLDVRATALAVARAEAETSRPIDTEEWRALNSGVSLDRKGGVLSRGAALLSLFETTAGK